MIIKKTLLVEEIQDGGSFRWKSINSRGEKKLAGALIQRLILYFNENRAAWLPYRAKMPGTNHDGRSVRRNVPAKTRQSDSTKMGKKPSINRMTDDKRASFHPGIRLVFFFLLLSPPPLAPMTDSTVEYPVLVRLITIFVNSSSGPLVSSLPSDRQRHLYRRSIEKKVE